MIEVMIICGCAAISFAYGAIWTLYKGASDERDSEE